MTIVAYYGQKVAWVWYVTKYVCDLKDIELYISETLVAERAFI
jgi:hypothetical protein